MKTGLASLVISVLGFGVAASVHSPSAAEGTDGSTLDVAAPIHTTITPGVEQPGAFQRDETTISRSNFRAALTEGADDTLDPATLTEAAAEAAEPARLDEASVKARTAELTEESGETRREAKELAKKERAKKKRKEAERKANGVATLPVRSYSIAARFGDVGSWARYHTGFDFSAPIGTEIYAPTAGVVMTAGSDSASGWAGTHVVLRHADGTQTLYAHMSSISVHKGDHVKGGTVLGQIGMTGRAFGPHLHFEVYPAGVKPEDVYRAVDPAPWLHRLGLKP
ncbi:MAG: M23 family metallopeptidase [Microlunatus sp.]|nr:M23 family metallopeptidase [Microlunatus sp.]